MWTAKTEAPSRPVRVCWLQRAFPLTSNSTYSRSSRPSYIFLHLTVFLPHRTSFDIYMPCTASPLPTSGHTHSFFSLLDLPVLSTSATPHAQHSMRAQPVLSPILHHLLWTSEV
ncbi:hypothetical protein M378DRAFT_173665 [Amanita muscaria Koide BX008]|uniref:Uncharacterized protein n=1 Tax=Amanita muscaria (strain Koide BX008) TaxID=946122 RepID=A0A0C2RYJ4_AMAMK|nr:hypothetical protein M378DRAFT_173665 [Amanita muscaria Koide BX008]